MNYFCRKYYKFWQKNHYSQKILDVQCIIFRQPRLDVKYRIVQKPKMYLWHYSKVRVLAIGQQSDASIIRRKYFLALKYLQISDRRKMRRSGHHELNSSTKHKKLKRIFAFHCLSEEQRRIV